MNRELRVLLFVNSRLCGLYKIFSPWTNLSLLVQHHPCEKEMLFLLPKPGDSCLMYVPVQSYQKGRTWFWKRNIVLTHRSVDKGMLAREKGMCEYMLRLKRKKQQYMMEDGRQGWRGSLWLTVEDHLAVWEDFTLKTTMGSH